MQATAWSGTTSEARSSMNCRIPPTTLTQSLTQGLGLLDSGLISTRFDLFRLTEM